MDILSALKKEKKELEKKLIQVNNAIKGYEPVPIQYMKWRIRALQCINGHKHFVQTAEILECTLEEEVYQQIIEDKELRKRYITGLSVALTYLCKDGELKKFYLKKRKGAFYGLPEWFESDGIPNESVLRKSVMIENKPLRDLLRA
jgi:hypothetical protein